MKLHEVTLRMLDGDTAPAVGPRLRARIEGRYRYFVVHPPHDEPTLGNRTITEESTGLRLTVLSRYVREPAAAQRLARARIAGMLEQGLGPRIHEEIERRSAGAPA